MALEAALPRVLPLLSSLCVTEQKLSFLSNFYTNIKTGLLTYKYINYVHVVYSLI